MSTELKLPWQSPRDAQALLGPPCTSYPFIGPSRKLLLSTASITGKVLRVLFDDGSPINFLSWRLVSSLRTNTKKTYFAAGMPESHSHVLDATDALDVEMGGYRERLLFAVSDLSSYDVMIGMRWREDKGARINYKNNTITINRKGKSITIKATLETSNNLSRQRLVRELKHRTRIFAVFVHGAGSGSHVDVNPIGVGAEADPSGVQHLLFEYEDVFPTDVIAGLPPERSRELHIELEEGAMPHRSGMYRLSESELAELKSQIAGLIKKGFIHPSLSPWGCSFIFSGNKDGGWRLCIDYRALNKAAIKNANALPRIDHIFDQLRHAKYFTKIDLRSGYHQIRLETASRPLTAFHTKYGFYEFTVVPLGLTNAPAVIIILMNDAFQEYLDKFIWVYLDDVLVYSENLEDHLRHLRLTLVTLRAHNP